MHAGVCICRIIFLTGASNNHNDYFPFVLSFSSFCALRAQEGGGGGQMTLPLNGRDGSNPTSSSEGVKPAHNKHPHVIQSGLHRAATWSTGITPGRAPATTRDWPFNKVSGDSQTCALVCNSYVPEKKNQTLRNCAHNRCSFATYIGRAMSRAWQHEANRPLR